MDQRFALGACTPQIAPAGPPPPQTNPRYRRCDGWRVLIGFSCILTAVHSTPMLIFTRQSVASVGIKKGNAPDTAHLQQRAPPPVPPCVAGTASPPHIPPQLACRRGIRTPVFRAAAGCTAAAVHGPKAYIMHQSTHEGNVRAASIEPEARPSAPSQQSQLVQAYR